MKTLPASLILEKNKLESTSPWLTLFTITINDTTKVRYIDYPEDIVFNGKTYVPFPIKFDAIREDSKAGLFDITMIISNVSKVIQGFLDNNELRGNKCNIKIVHKDFLGDSTAVIKERFEIVSWRSNDREVTFTLGSLSLLGSQFPSSRMLADHCRHIYRGLDGDCAYRDSLGAGTITSVGTAVTGVGTAFNAAITFDANLGDDEQGANADFVNATFDSIEADGESREVLSVESDTALTLKKAFTANIASAASWTRFRTACTLNLEGVNGCRSHGNDEIIHGMIDFTNPSPSEVRKHPERFGGFPSLIPGLQIAG